MLNEHGTEWIKDSETNTKPWRLVTLTFSPDQGRLNYWAKMNWICSQKTSEIGCVLGEEAVASNSDATNWLHDLEQVI